MSECIASPKRQQKSLWCAVQSSKKIDSFSHSRGRKLPFISSFLKTIERLNHRNSGHRTDIVSLKHQFFFSSRHIPCCVPHFGSVRLRLSYSSILNVILVLTPTTSTGCPSTTRGLYLNFSTALDAARSKRLLVENMMIGSFTVPDVVTVKDIST